jgi:hypothetical protein
MVQTGFIIGVGLLIDTFMVRTITVPALAAMIGRANWWPSKPTAALDTADTIDTEVAPSAAQIPVPTPTQRGNPDGGLLVAANSCSGLPVAP